MNIGIICEYNPFHYGHLYHINKIKEMYPNSNIILVLSGFITQRGDLSIIDPFDKAKIALKYGINLVIELPIKYIGSADYFAKGALEILNKLKCDILVFGSESNDIELISKIAKVQIENKEIYRLQKKYILEGLNYPTALSKAIYDVTNLKINTPNDLLGISYVKEIIKNKYKITPITIKRESNYNSKEIEGKITSASSIREAIFNKKNIKSYVPNLCYKLLNPIFLDDYFDLIKYKIITDKSLLIYKDLDKNVENRIKKYINESNSLEELIQNVKTKNYTYNKIKRCLISILFDIKKDEFIDLNLEFIRILGFDKQGKKVLNSIKKEIDIPILSSYNSKYLSKNLTIRKILAINNRIKNKNTFIEREYKEKPTIIK